MFIKKIAKKNILAFSLLSTVVLSFIMAIIVDPQVSSESNQGLLDLQFSFYKENALNILGLWGEEGIRAFNRFIFIDYLYPISYSIFLSSLLSRSILKLEKPEKNDFYFVLLPFGAGLFDFIENTMEISFVNNPISFSSELFFLHSIIAVIKWCGILTTVALIIKNYILVFENKQNNEV